MTRRKNLIAIFCRVHFVFSFQLFFSSTVFFRLQRWSPRGHILKSLASKPQVFENCPVLGSRTALFFESLNLCRSREKNFCRRCFFGVFLILFFGDNLKNFFENLFFKTREKNFEDLIVIILFGEHLRLCPSPRKGLSSEGLSLASDIFLCPWPRALCPRLHLSPVSV